MPRPLIWIHDLRDAQVVPIHELDELVVEDRLGDLETLGWVMRADDIKARFVLPDRLARYRDRLYRIEEIEQYRDGARPLVKVYAEARWLDLGKVVRAGQFTLLGKTAAEGLTAILTLTGWTGLVDPVDFSLYSMEDVDSSVLALLRRWAAVVGRELQWDTVAKTVTLVPSLGTDRGTGFRWGHNLRAIKRRYRPPIATRLYAFGASNLEITPVNPDGVQYVENYQWYIDQGLTLAEARARFRKDQVWNDERYLLAINLYDAAVRRLAALSAPVISYELSVADFAKLTATTADDTQLGDTVRVRDADFGIDIPTRVVRIVRHDLRPQDNEIELDYLQPGLGEIETVSSSSSRSIDYGELVILVDQNDIETTVTGVNTPLASVQLTSTGETTVVAGATIKGTATGTGTVRWSIAVDGVDQAPTYDFAFTAGPVEFSWPTFVAGIDAVSTRTVDWRGRVISGTGTIAVAPNEGRGWLLVRGAVGVGISNSPNQAIEETIGLLEHTITATPTVSLLTEIAIGTSFGDTVVLEVAVVDDTTTAPVITLF